MNRIAVTVLLGAVLGACSENTATPPIQLTLNRPVDMSFACYGPLRLNAAPGQPVIPATAQPQGSCELRSPQLKPLIQGDVDAQNKLLPASQASLDGYGWWGFILQSAQGTVALASWPVEASDVLQGNPANAPRVIDADPLTPSKNAISIGEEPIGIVTDTSGCFEVTANAGSCDLSTLEVNSAVDGDPSTPVVVRRLAVRNAAGVPMLARPAAIVAQPNVPVDMTYQGNSCPMTAGGLIYLAYPSCHRVVGVSLETDATGQAFGKIVAGIQFDATGTATIMAGPDVATMTCRAECPGPAGAPVTPAPPAGKRPVALDLRLEPRVATRKLVIGAEDLAAVTVVNLDATYLPQATQRIPLEDKTGTLGLTAVSLSQEIGMGGELKTPRDTQTTDKPFPPVNNDAGPSPGGQHQYVYAVATDGTVRVVDVGSDPPDTSRAPVECDTQVDPRFARGAPASVLACFPVGDPATPIRRAGARGPGIELPDQGVPTSVAVIKGLSSIPITGKTVGQVTTYTENFGQDNAPGSVLLGHFAAITSSSGATYIVNIDNDIAPDVFTRNEPIATNPALLMAHQLRDTFTNRGAGPPPGTDPANPPKCEAANPQGSLLAGGPRASTAPVSNASGGVPGTISVGAATELPLLRQVGCSNPAASDAGTPLSELQFSIPEQVRDEVFPDIGAVRNEIWTLTYEGALSRDSSTSAVDGPIIRSGQVQVDGTGMYLTDHTQPYCEMGVEPFDNVQFRGCNPANGNSDCPADYDCFVHPQSQVAIGACLLHSEADRLANTCRDFLLTIRHYTVGRTKSDQLLLLPRKRVLRTTPLDGCTSDAQCTALANYAARSAVAVNPLTAVMPTDPHSWKCMTDDARAPVNADPARNKRCIETCALHSPELDGKDRDADCDANTICQGATPTTPGFCMEGVTPPQACVNGPERYEVHASEAFTVIGTTSGYIHPIINVGGTCVRDVTANPVQVGRIPLKAPACNPLADPITGKVGTVFEANPCATSVEQTELRPNYANQATCELGDPATMIVHRPDAPAIKLRTRSMTLTLVDPYYPGDATCIGDRRGAPGIESTDRVPLVFPPYQLSFTQTGGFLPVQIVSTSLSVSFPVKVVRGPSDSLWLMDYGDLLSNSLGQPSTRGNVFRADPVSVGGAVAVDRLTVFQ